MATERTFVNDGSYLNAVEESRSWVQLFPGDQSSDAGVWVIRFKQDVKTFRSTNFPLTTITHTASAKTLTNPNTGALKTFYLVGENITGIEYGCIVNFERIYAPEIGNIETVSSQSINIPDWSGLSQDGTYAATIDNRRTAIYTARKAVEAISELKEAETIKNEDLKATIHGTLHINGTTSDLTQSVDDIWKDLFLVTGIVSVQKSSTKIRLNTTNVNLDTWDVSITGMQSGTGYIVSINNTYNSYLEIEFVYTRSIVSGLLTLQSRDPKIIYTSDFSAGVDGWIGEYATLEGNIDGIGGEDNCLRITQTSLDYGGVTQSYPVTPTAPSSGAYFCKCDVYIPSSGGVSIVWLGNTKLLVRPDTQDRWVTLTYMYTGVFSEACKLVYGKGLIGDIFYIKNYTIETINRTIDLSGSIEDIRRDLNLEGFIQSIVKDSENIRFFFGRYIDVGWISSSISNANSYVSYESTGYFGNDLQFTFHDDRRVGEITTNAQSQRTLTVTSHGLIQGDVVALFAGDALVAVTTCTQVIDTNNFTIPANALPGADDIVTHIGDKSTQSIFSSYPQTVLVETRKKVYIPGVTSGIDSLSDIPVRQGLDTPQSWLVAIAEGLITAQIEGTQIEHPYPGLYIATESEFEMADVLNQTDSFLADIDETFIIADW